LKVMKTIDLRGVRRSIDKEVNMGLSFGGCSSSPYAVPNSNPNPRNFKVIREQTIRGFLVVEVEYPDAKNFEGRKIMVYSGFTSSKDLLDATCGELDPHFSEHGVSPVARFKPGFVGWKHAINFAYCI